MDVVFKEGVMYLQVVKFGKRTWRKMWMMLFKPSTTGVGRLEICTAIDNNATTGQKVTRLKEADRKVIRLSDCLSVTPATEESCPPGCTALYLNTMQSRYTLASTASQAWHSALCHLAFQKDPGESGEGGFERGNSLTMKDNDLYSSWEREPTLPPNRYRVTVQSTEASRRCKLAGEYLITPDRDAVLLLDVQTGHLIIQWPYCFLRKFGNVEGGFSIEAGRRCESGEGVFIFLSRSGPQIFQAISKQCSMAKDSFVQPLNSYRRSFSDHFPLYSSTTSNEPAAPPIHKPADASADVDYATVSIYSTVNVKQSSSVVSYPRRKAMGLEDEDERCHSLEAVNLDNIIDYNMYYNLRRATPPMVKKGQLTSDINDLECIYSDVTMVESLDEELEPYSSFQPVPELPPFAPPTSSSSPLLRPRYQGEPPVNNIQPGSNTQALPVGDMKEMEEAISSSTSITPSEPAGTFKQRLEEIFSKDLARSMQSTPFGGDSPTYSQ